MCNEHKLYRDLAFEQSVIDKLSALHFSTQPKRKAYTHQGFLKKEKPAEFLMLMQGRYFWHQLFRSKITLVERIRVAYKLYR